MKKTLAFLTAGVLVLSAGNYAYAQGQPSQNDGQQKQHMKHHNKQQFEQQTKELQDRLKLTEEQIEKTKQMRMDAHPVMKGVMDELHAKTRELINLKETGASQEEIDAKNAEFKELRKKANEIRKEHMEQFESILTPEQKAEFAKIKAEMKEKRKEHMQKRHEKRNERKEKEQQ